MVAAALAVLLGAMVWLTTADTDGFAASGRRPLTSSSSTTSTSTTTTTTTTTMPPPIPMAIPAGATAPVISRVTTTDPVVFFTIDDGLVQDPAVIDYLRAERIPVTIFPVPQYVHQNPAYFQAIRALGGSVQDHSMTHPDLRRLGAAAQQGEICGPLDEYAGLFGTRPWLFRPPFFLRGTSSDFSGLFCRGVVHSAKSLTDPPRRPADVGL